MIWKGLSLIDAPVVTEYLADQATLVIGRETLRVVSDNATDVRAASADGRSYRLVKRSATVARYEAICDGARYLARRTGGRLWEKRREITDGSGRLVAVTRGLPNGDLELEVAGGAEEFTVDLAFISWALLLVDAPVRRTLY